MLLVQFGAGNIGRGFIGSLFARAGYEVCFVDVDPVLVEGLRARGGYRVEIRDDPPGELIIEGVRAVDGRDADLVVAELLRADVAGTAVGPNVLPRLAGVLARAVLARAEAGRPPLDVILCENLRNAASAVRASLAPHLPEGFPLERHLGLVETSIGKMVPLLTKEDREEDPLRVAVEAYDTLICDRLGFRNGVPPVAGLDPKSHMAAWVDRKLYIHNLGHAAAAYIGHASDPSLQFVWEVMERPAPRAVARAAMWEAGRALIAQYPGEFDEAAIGAHIDDLLRRFGNRALGDTVHRVGRDLARKLSGEDRLVGALKLEATHGGLGPATLLAAACALHFRAPDEEGRSLATDESIVARVEAGEVREVLASVTGLDATAEPDGSIMRGIEQAERWVRERPGAALLSSEFHL